MVMAKSQTIKIQVGEEVIELTGAEKEAYLEQHAKDQAQSETRQAQQEAQKQTKIAAYTKLGLTEEEINAIL